MVAVFCRACRVRRGCGMSIAADPRVRFTAARSGRASSPRRLAQRSAGTQHREPSAIHSRTRYVLKPRTAPNDGLVARTSEGLHIRASKWLFVTGVTVIIAGGVFVAICEPGLLHGGATNSQTCPSSPGSGADRHRVGEGLSDPLARYRHCEGLQHSDGESAGRWRVQKVAFRECMMFASATSWRR